MALERAGGQCVFSSDWNEQVQITYEANHGERPHGDIHDVAVADIRWARVASDSPRRGGKGEETRTRCILIRATSWSACARPPASTGKAKSNKRSRFRVASRNITALYESVETVEV